MNRKFKLLFKEAVGFILFAVLVFVLLGYLRSPDPKIDTLIGESFELIDGTRYTPSKGKPLLVYLWASWCKTCKMTQKNIEEISKHYEVLTIALQSGSDEEVKKYAKNHNLSFRIHNDQKGKWASMLGVEVFPSVLIFDSNGYLKYKDSGYVTTAGLWARIKNAH